MVQTVEAVVANGALKLTTPLQGMRDGQRVQVTVAPLSDTSLEGLSEEEQFLKRLEQQGLLDTTPWPAVEGPKDFQPIKISGPPISETIIEDRR